LIDFVEQPKPKPEPELEPKPEKTVILHGEEATTGAILDLAASTKKLMYVCADSMAPSVTIGVPKFRQALLDLVARGVEYRFITEITKENLAYCKELQKHVQLRHLDSVRGNFVVNEHEYIATAIVFEQAKPVPEIIYSSVKSIVDQHHYLFLTLWNKSVPAEQRIREIEEGVLPPQTRAVQDPLEILKDTMRMVSRSEKYSVCSVSNGLLYAYNYSFDTFREVLDRCRAGSHRGIRWITKLESPDSRLVEIIRTFAKLGMQVRHADNIPPMSFGISEKETGLTVEKMQGGALNSNAIFSSEPVFVNHFAAIFEELWSRAIDIEDRLRELEEDDKTFIEVINDPVEIQKRYHALVSSAKNQVMLFLPTTTAYRREEKIGIFDSLEAAAARGVEVRIILPSDEEIESRIQQRLEPQKALEIRSTRTTNTVQARTKILIVDCKQYLIVELKDDTKDTFVEAVGSAIFSNSRSTVLSYIDIFESLWKQSELYDKLEAHDRMQKEFINIAAHELRTPIQPILGLAELIKAESDSRRERETGIKIQHEDFDMLVRNAKRLERLTSDILDVARIESKSFNLHKERFNLGELISDIVKDSREHLGDSKVKIQYYLPSKIFVNADRSRIAQVIHNLLHNAIKFTKEGTISIKAEEDKNGQITVAIKDTGAGISTDIMPMLFTKFATKSEKGTGLGLYISKSIIEQHGGNIWADNNAEGGATFWFSIPA
jgi:nitrogen-specific signal transduction histidine kinase